MKNQLIQIKYGIYWMVVVNGNPFAAVSQGPSWHKYLWYLRKQRSLGLHSFKERINLIRLINMAISLTIPNIPFFYSG